MLGEKPSLLTAFLAEQDHPCPECEYNLRGLQGNRCPECGEKLMLRVNAVEPRQRLLITGLVGLSAGAGLNGLLLVYALIQILRGDFGGDAPFWRVTCIGLAAELLAIYLWLRSWRRIRRSSLPRRAALATGCFLLTMVDIVFFSFWVK